MMNLFALGVVLWLLSRSNMSGANYVTFTYNKFGRKFDYQVLAPQSYRVKTVGKTSDGKRTYECWYIANQPETRIDITDPSDGQVISTQFPMVTNRGDGYYPVIYKPDYVSGTRTSLENFGREGYYYANLSALFKVYATAEECEVVTKEYLEAYETPNKPNPDDDMTPEDDKPPNPEGDPEGEQGGGIGGGGIGMGQGMGGFAPSNISNPPSGDTDNPQPEIVPEQPPKVKPLSTKQSQTQTALNGRARGGMYGL